MQNIDKEPEEVLIESWSLSAKTLKISKKQGIMADGTHKQCSFNPSWYDEFLNVEYSIEKDAAFNCMCFLVPSGPGHEKSENSWVSTGVRTWHKFKSPGKQKKGKLAEHFSSDHTRQRLLHL